MDGYTPTPKLKSAIDGTEQFIVNHGELNMPLYNSRSTPTGQPSRNDIAAMLRTLHYSRNKLEMVIEALAGLPFCKGHVREIAKEMKRRTPEWTIAKPEEAVTRTINNHCAEAQDFRTRGQKALFKRVDSATYQLLPGVKWYDHIGHDGTARWDYPVEALLWGQFCAASTSKQHDWSSAPLAQRLVQFANYLQQPDVRARLKKHSVD